MKKTYIIPAVSKMELSVESTILAGSYKVGPGTSTDEVLTKKRGWSADDWTVEEEE